MYKMLFKFAVVRYTMFGLHRLVDTFMAADLISAQRELSRMRGYRREPGICYYTRALSKLEGYTEWVYLEDDGEFSGGWTLADRIATPIWEADGVPYTISPSDIRARRSAP